MFRVRAPISAAVVVVAAVAGPSTLRAEPGGPFVSSVAFALQAPAYSEVASPLTVTPGTVVHLTVTADESLKAGTVSYSGPETLSTLGTVSGNTIHFALPILRQLTAGTYSAKVTLVDAGSTARTSTVSLPAPGFVVVDVVQSQCQAPLPDGSLACTDLDGDGQVGVSAACPFSFDCDDTNATVYFNAPDVPGDGVDGDCFGDGDTPVDETVGVFVAPPPPNDGGVDADGDMQRARAAAWYDYASSCNLFQDDDGGLYFWDAAGTRGTLQCRTFASDVVTPSRAVTSAGACWTPIWAKNPANNAIVTPIAAVGPAGAQSEVEFSSTNCGLSNTAACTVRWKPNNAIVTANLGSGGSGWYTGASTVTVRKPAWATECPLPGSASAFTWSPPGIGSEDPSCTECDGSKAVWAMTRGALADEKWQYQDNPHAHPTVVVIHEGNMKSIATVAPDNRPDQQSTIASEHWPMFTLSVLGNLHVNNSSTLVVGVGTRKNGFPSIIVDGNFQGPSNSQLFLAGVSYVRGNVNGPVPPTVFGRFIEGEDDTEDGTREHPFHTLRSGVEAATAAGKVVFVALGSYDDGGAPLDIPVSLFGGFVDIGWTREPLTHSNAAFAFPSTWSAEIYVGMAVDIGGSGALTVTPNNARFRTALFDDVVTGGAGDIVTVNGQARMVRNEIVGPTLLVPGNLGAVRSSFDDVTLPSGGIAVVSRVEYNGAVSTSRGIFKSTRSVFAGPLSTSAANVNISQSTFLSGAAVSSAGGSVELTNNIFAGTGTNVAHTNAIMRPRGNLFGGSCAVSANGTCLVGCPLNNVCGAPSFVGAGDFHITAGSLAHNTATHDTKLIPSMSVVDLDGECIGTPDIGADAR